MPFYVVFHINESLCAQGSMVAVEADTDEEAVSHAAETATAELGVEVWQGPRLVYRTDLAGAAATSPAS